MVNLKKKISDLYNALNFKNTHSKALGKAVSVSLLNQMVSSGANFLLGWYLVRVLTVENYGFYGIGFAVSVFFAGIGDSLFLSQMVIHTPDKAPEHRLPYAARMFAAVSLFCLVTFSLVLIVFSFGGFFWKPLNQYTAFAYAVAAASIAFHVKDFFVRHSYNQRREIRALEINLVVALFMVGLLAGNYFFHYQMTVIIALWIYAIANSIADFFAFLRAQLPLMAIQYSLAMGDWREAWQGGKLMSISNIVYALRTQAHVIVVGFLIGPTGVGMLNAARLLVMPAILLTPALSQVFSPRLNTIRTESLKKVSSVGFVYSLGLLGIAVVYSLFLLSAYKQIEVLVLSKKYESLFGVTFFWCLYTCFLSFRSGAEVANTALKQFSRLLWSNAAGAVAALGFTFFMTKLFGLSGSLMGLSIGEIVMTMILLDGMKQGWGSLFKT